MMKIKDKKGVFIIVIFFTFILLVSVFIRDPNNVRIKVDDIRRGFKGKIIEKYSVRNTFPTHLEIMTQNSVINISPNQQIVKEANVGDSIVKPENENYIFLINPSGLKKKFFYTKISYKTRDSKYFPKEWKNKWLNSSK